MSQIEIVSVIPLDDGLAAGKATGASAVRADIDTILPDCCMRDTFGQMSRVELYRQVMARLDIQHYHHPCPYHRARYTRRSHQGAILYKIQRISDTVRFVRKAVPIQWNDRCHSKQGAGVCHNSRQMHEEKEVMPQTRRRLSPRGPVTALRAWRQVIRHRSRNTTRP